jgi:hypothetical protein
MPTALQADIPQAFAELHARLDILEKRLNPQDENLHFRPRLADLGQKDFSDMLALAEDGLLKVREHESYFLEARLYADGMFWYHLFLLISAASLQSLQVREVSEPTQRRLVEVLVDISRYSLVGGPSDIGKRNHEALGNLFCGFPSPTLRTLARDRAQHSPQMAEFVSFTVRAVEAVEQRKHSTAPATA